MIFVTGANGFIGRHVVAALGGEQASAVVGDRPLLRVLLSRPRETFGERFPGAETVCGDLLDEEVLARGLRGAHTVIHLASKTIDRDGQGFDVINVEGTRRLCRLAVAAGVRRLIYVSSVGVYGHGARRGVDETTPRAPDTPFSRSKAAAEDIVLGHHHGGDLQAVVLRHRFVYGEGDEAVLPRLIRAARRYPFWISGGRAKMSLIWAGDLAEIVRRFATGAISALDTDPVYHATDGRPITYREVVTHLCAVFGYRPPKISIPLGALYWPVRLREVVTGIDPEVSSSSITSIRLRLVAQDNYFSSRKLERLLGDWRPLAFAEGLESCRDYYQRFAD